MLNKKFITALVLALLCMPVFISAQKKKSKGLQAIRETDIKKDLFEMADDHFAGREAGTLNELKVSVWWANKMKAAGLEPMGDDGKIGRAHV